MGGSQNTAKQGELLAKLKPRQSSKSRQRFGSLFLLSAGLSLGIAGCNQITLGQKRTVEPIFASYAVTRSAYEKIIPQFVQQWKLSHSQNVNFGETYRPSGAQTRAVIDGLPADIVALALGFDVKKIERSGLIQSGWEKEAPNYAIAHKSVVVLVTREGNPKNIKTWADLARDDVSVITANPKTSGGARWNFLALWGSVTQSGKTEAEALEFTRKVFQNAPVLPSDAREASDAFLKQNKGDVLITYENEVILAQANGKKVYYVVPDVNISIDSPVAIVDKNVDRHKTREVAAAFVKFLFTPAAQREFAKAGFRPIHPTVAKEFVKKYPTIKTLFTVQDLGGWDKVQKQFFEDNGIFDQIQASIR